MGHGMGEDFLHIAGHHIIPAPEPGHGLCHGGDSQGGPGGGTPENMFILPGGHNQVYDVIHHRIADEGLLHLVLHGGQLLPGQQGLQLLQGIGTLAAEDHGHFIPGAGIAQGQPDDKPVHLAVGQQLGAGGTGGGLGGNDHKGLGQGMADTVHCDLALFHGFQQGGLGPGGGPVQFVRQEQVGEHGTGLIVQLLGLGIGNAVTRHIRGQHIGGELDAAVAQVQHFGKGQSHGGLAHAGDVLQQDVAPGQNGGQDPQHHTVLAHHGGPHLVQDLLSRSCDGGIFGLHSKSPFLWVRNFYHCTIFRREKQVEPVNRTLRWD